MNRKRHLHRAQRAYLCNWSNFALRESKKKSFSKLSNGV